MYMFKLLISLFAVMTASACSEDVSAPLGGGAHTPGLGQPASTQPGALEWSLNVLPDGGGLPPGSGTATQGEQVYIRYCAACHGIDGRANTNDPLAGGIGTLSTDAPVITVGSYWPYATTLFDYTRRAMPYFEPTSLTDDEYYAVVAYILFLNDLVSKDDLIDAQKLPEIKMPNAAGFRQAK